VKDDRLIGIEKLAEYVSREIIKDEDICLIGSLGFASLIEAGRYLRPDGTFSDISEEARNSYREYILKGRYGMDPRKIGDLDLCFIRKEGMTEKDAEIKHMVWIGIEDFEGGSWSIYQPINHSPKMSDLPKEAKAVTKDKKAEDKLDVEVKGSVDSKDLVKIKVGESQIYVPKPELFMSHKIYCAVRFGDYQKEKAFADCKAIFDVLKKSSFNFKDIVDTTYNIFEENACRKLPEFLEQVLKHYDKNVIDNKDPKCPPNELIRILRALVEKDIRTKPEGQRLLDSKTVREKLLGGRKILRKQNKTLRYSRRDLKLVIETLKGRIIRHSSQKRRIVSNNYEGYIGEHSQTTDLKVL
jgi:hypothetical protein